MTKAEKKTAKKQKAAAKQAKKDAKMAKAKSVKWVPLIIVVALIAAIVLCADFILAFTLSQASQSAFGAKCDIEKVHLSFMDSSLTITGYQQGDAANPMRNLFQFDSLVCDIDINQLLTKHVAIDEMTLSGLALGMPRETSATLKSKSAGGKKDEADTETATEGGSSKGASSKNPLLPSFDYTSILKTLTARISEGVMNALPVADAQQLMDSLQNDLQTPKKTDEIKSLSESLTAKWQGTPEELTDRVSTFADKAQKARNISVNKDSSIYDIQKAISQLTDLYTEGDALQKKIRTSYTEVQADSKKLSNGVSALKKAVEADRKMISSSVSSITSDLNFSPSFFNEVAVSVWDSVLGEAKPYLTKGKKILAIVSGKKTDDEPKKETRKRLTGTTYTWDAEYPDVYIGKVHFSGMGYTGEVLDVSSNQYITDKPTTAQIKHKKTDGIQDSISLFMDVRGKEYSEDLFTADIIWNTPVALQAAGSFDGTMSGSTVNFTYGADDSARFAANGVFTDVNMYPPASGQATVDRILKASLSDIDTVSAAVSHTSGNALRTSTTLPAVIKSRATGILKEESAALAAEINQQAGQLLAQYVEDATGYTAEFNTITGAYEELTNSMAAVQKEISVQIESYKKQAANAATAAAQEAVQSAVTDAAEKAGTALKGLFGR